MAITDVTHTIIAGKPRREGSAALNIAGTGTQFLDSRIVEHTPSTINEQLDDQFDRSDQHVLIDGQPIGVSGVLNINDIGGISTVEDGVINKLAVSDLSSKDFQNQFLIQLKILNTHLATMTEQEIDEYDIISQE